VRIRIVVVDDFGVVRDGLRLLLDAEADIETVGEAETFQEAVQTVHELQPDVVLLDLLMHERVTIDGIPAEPRGKPRGVAELIAIAVDLGRKARPDLMVGICGEHGGDPASIAYCHSRKLNYVSCSPFRVPVARLAAAHAALRTQATARDK